MVIMSNSETIYVKLLDEGVDVWKPVLARRGEIPNSFYIHQFLEIPKGEQWEFSPGSCVLTKEMILEGQRVVAAYKLADWELIEKKRSFWKNYRKDAILRWLYLVLTPMVPITIGLLVHLIAEPSKFVSVLLELTALVPMSLFAFHSYRVGMAECPHCHQYVARFGNIIFPTNPVCKHCGRRMDQVDDES